MADEKKPRRQRQAVAETTAEHQPPEQSANGANPQEKDTRRPSVADPWGRPPVSGGGSLAGPLLQVTRDQQNWLATGILTEREIAWAKRMLARQMTRHGRLDMERLVFQAGHLARSKNGYSIELYAEVAKGEMRLRGAIDNFYNRFQGVSNAQLPQPTTQTPQGGQ
jgi:hypothetical protein